MCIKHSTFNHVEVNRILLTQTILSARKLLHLLTANRFKRNMSENSSQCVHLFFTVSSVCYQGAVS